MKRVLLVFLVVLISVFLIQCDDNITHDVVLEDNTDSIVIESIDSLDDMMAYIKYIDSAGVVEQVSNNFTELKETNEKLESTLKETKAELQSTREELVETKVALVESEKIVKAISGDSNSTSAGFELLPIKK
jgi:peptidoglycan hydrolase CwlO-like protein